MPDLLVMTKAWNHSFLGIYWTLNEVQKDKILLELLSDGKGSLDYARHVAEFDEPVPNVPSDKPSWCTCGVCQLMASKEENKCCGKIRCATSFVTFQTFFVSYTFLYYSCGKSRPEVIFLFVFNNRNPPIFGPFAIAFLRGCFGQ